MSEIKSARGGLPVLSPELEKALASVCPSEDPLDDALFDPIAFLNGKFPSEEALHAGLDPFADSLKLEVGLLAEDISKEVRQQSLERAKTKLAIQSATQAIEQLFNRVKAVKEKASQSEIMVQEICADIKSLDYAKKNLTNTIRSLHDLHMLVSTIQQLEHTAGKNLYMEAASLIEAINGLFTKFEEYRKLPKLRQLQSEVDDMKMRLKGNILDEFRHVIPKPLSSTVDYKHYQHACYVIDALRGDVKQKFLLWVANQLLYPYEGMFGASKAGGSLDQTERRFAWLRRELRSFEDTAGELFPNDWSMSAVVVYHFCKMTRAHLEQLLRDVAAVPDSGNGAPNSFSSSSSSSIDPTSTSNSSPGKPSSLSSPPFVTANIDTEVLIRALQKTLEFEAEVTRRYRNAKVAHISYEMNSAYINKDKDSHESKLAAVKDKYKSKSKEQARNAFSEGEDVQYCAFDYSGLISPVFTPYMGGYVDLEAKNMGELLAKNERAEKWIPDESDEQELRIKSRYTGSDNILLYIQQSMNRCSKLTTGPIFYNVQLAYQNALSNYGSILSSKLHTKPGALVSSGQLKSLCLIANTAVYMVDTVPDLESRIKEIVDEDLALQVDFSATQEKYSVLLNAAIAAVVNAINAKLVKELVKMEKKPWNVWESVGDQSDYVTSITQIFKEQVPVVVGILTAKYRNYFFNQMAKHFIEKYIESIFKCKKVSQTGAQQLSLDTVALRSTCLHIPQFGSTEAKKNRVFERYVNKEMGRAEAILKVVVSPTEFLIMTFKQLINPPKMDVLAKIFVLRGLKKSEQQAIVDTYNRSVPAEEKVVPHISDEGKVRGLFRGLI
jgi:hypothetical protein